MSGNEKNSLIPCFKDHHHMCVGIEREFFLRDGRSGLLVPAAHKVLEAFRAIMESQKRMQWTGPWMGVHYEAVYPTNRDRLTYEFSACQIEDRTSPHSQKKELYRDLSEGRSYAGISASNCDLEIVTLEVAPPDMPTNHYAEDERYVTLSQVIPPDILLAAYRITGTHFHIGMSSIEEAVETHDALCREIDKITSASDHSNGERLQLYNDVVSWAMPADLVPAIGTSPEYGSTEGWLNYLRRCKTEKLKDCWDLIRISDKGTVEIRCPGVTESTEEIFHWLDIIFSILGRRFW